MTPLAMQFVKKTSDGAADGAPGFVEHLQRYSDLQCFEVSEVAELVFELMKVPLGVLEQTLFLPAPNTWIERRFGGGRVALHLIEGGDGSIAINRCDDHDWTSNWVCDVGKSDDGIGWWRHSPAFTQNQVMSVIAVVLCNLAIINTPKLIARVDQRPHKGLQRRLERCGHPIELRPWSTLKLTITPRLATGDSTHESSITGRKCLHFCRSHLRIQNGKLVVVRPHWRGDAALGVKSKDYVVAA